jgi:hypothetical protein
MIVRLYLFLFLICSSAALHAQQFPFEVWHEGKMVLDDGDTLRGTIKYDLQNDLIQFQKDEKLESYSARKVLYFEIFDVTIKRYRNFFSLPYTTAGQYKAPVFFELLVEGKLTVLCREAVELRTYSSPFYYYGTYTRQVLVNKYFILKDNGSIEEFISKRNDWYQLMGNKSDEVQRYAKTNKLDLDEKYELVQVLNYYNSLFNQQK